ncbi:hypothetical protein WICMUC_003884 [Wickerhamomyces mucosus]|uniref:Zn(2)-C6 fungal-type domain-containing protein n=1 Tax=Wickerhamomyces mucosus TaxID=1378264 RepID=A0A9P8TB75_9ASCO|nr:hypothetical protein WICMUC_003884 [Wickerhamomyces mucosus]
MEDKLVPMKDQNALVMGDGKVYKIQKIRQRKIHSCVACHQRKIKCSRDQPVCQNCVKNNLECKYFVNDRVSRGKKNKDIDQEIDLKKKQELKEYMEKAKTMVKVEENSSPQTDDSLTPLSVTQVSTDQISVNRVPDLLSSNPQVPSPKAESDISSSNESFSPPKIVHSETLPTNKQHHIPNFTSESHSTEFDDYATNSPTNINDFHPIRQQTPQLSTKFQYNEFKNTNPNMANLSLCLPQILIPRQPQVIPLSRLEEIFSALPNKERSYGLIKRYRTSIHPVFPILDLKEFERQHDLFWDNSIDDKLDFLSLLYPVLYSASKAECFEFSYDEITKFELSNEIHKYLRIARLTLETIEYPKKTSLAIIQSVVLLQTTLENPSLIDVAILVRIAQTMKLHRDPSTYHNITDASLIELRRLLWWEIFYIDTMAAFKNLSTPLIKIDESDTSLPSEFFFNQLNITKCHLNAKYRYSLILNELATYTYGLPTLQYNSVKALKKKILNLYSSCNTSILNLDNYMKTNQHILNYDQSNFIDWAKSTINTYCDRLISIIQKRIILSHVLSMNDEDNKQIFNDSYNQMINNKKSRFSINDSVFNTFGNNDVNFNYSYDDTSNNLIPSSLHYLYEFLKNNNNDVYNHFNWEIRNNLPFDAILLVLTNLITDLEKNSNNKTYELRNDIRYHLLDKVIDLIFIKFDNKKRSIIKNCFTLIRYLFQILRLKHLRNDPMGGSSNDLIEFDSFFTEQIIPKPVHDKASQRKERTILPTTFQQLPQTVNCGQIIPRAMTAISGSNGSISFSESVPFNSISVSDIFINGLTSEVGGYSSQNSANNSLMVSENGSMVNLSQIGNSSDNSYKEHELQRIKSQIFKFFREERLADDDKFNNSFYVSIEKEVKELIERLLR